MKILVINCGSTTVKFQLIEMDNEEVIAKGKCDKIGSESSPLSYKNVRDGYSNKAEFSMPTHREALQIVLNALLDPEHGVIKSLDEIYAVGHRVAHGGDRYSAAALVDEKVEKDINELGEIAPLHNPGSMMGINAIKELAPNLPNVVVFDTAFHQTIPDYNYLYAVNYEYYTKYNVRKYGFHGTSYAYVLDRLSVILQKPKEKINAIICHLGGGASICAIKDGKSYDASMGFTPLEGLVMETRSGDIDPIAVFRIMKKENLSIDEMNEVLNKKSGRLGLCGIGDKIELVEASNAGNKKAILTEKLQANRTKKYIGGYFAELGRVDAIAFTGGIGENDYDERELTLRDMKHLGVEIDKELNLKLSGKEAKISTEDSKIPVYIVPTNEELEIAIQTKDVVEKM